jgi:hypothetical protein
LGRIGVCCTGTKRLGVPTFYPELYVVIIASLDLVSI